ncbi:hypothetical protein ABEF91_008638 [Exophiala dermatitidis]
MAELCGFVGNPDAYGLGIRTGIYTQVISTLITNHFLPKELNSTWTANLIFVSALILALVKSISQSNGFFAAEGFVLLQLILLFFLAVISASGGVFVLVDLFCSFLDGSLDAETYKMLKQISDPNEKILLPTQKLSKLGRAYSDGSPLRYTARLMLALATSSLNLWYWISGAQILQHDTAGCSTKVFLFGRVGVTGPVRTFFIVMGTFYAAWHFVILLFGTFPFPQLGSKDSVKEMFLAAFDPRSPAERARSKGIKGLLDEELHSQKQHKQTPSSKRILLCLHIVMFTWSSAVIVYSILAVELTLAWNHVRGVYDVSSTGQLIPLFIGLVGLVRAVLSALVEHSGRIKKKSADRPPIILQQDTGAYRYWVPPSDKRPQVISFKARRPERRWSCDGAIPNPNDTEAPTVEWVKTHEAPAPVSPVHPDWEEKRLRKEAGVRPPPKVLWPTARFIYEDGSGHRHAFHDTLIARRISWHAGFTYRPPTEPHREREIFQTPLRRRRQAFQQEEKRKNWWRRKLADLERQRETKKHADIADLSSERWQRFRSQQDDGSGSDLSRRSSSSAPTDVSGPPWLPADVDNETLLWMRSYNEAFPPARRSVLWFRSTNSLRDINSVYSGIDGRDMPFLRSLRGEPYRSSDTMVYAQRSSSGPRGGSRWGHFDRPSSSLDSPHSSASSVVFVPTTRRGRRNRSTIPGGGSRSRSGSGSGSGSRSHSAASSRSRSRSHSSSGSTISIKRKRHWPIGYIILGLFMIAVMFVFNALCLCSPCSSLYRSLKSLRKRCQAYFYERRVKANADPGPVRAHAALYYCPRCDHDLRSYEHTREWVTVRPPKSKVSRWDRREFFRKANEDFGPAYTKRTLFFLAGLLLNRLAQYRWTKELGHLIRSRMEPILEAQRAFEEEEESKRAESASSPV